MSLSMTPDAVASRAVRAALTDEERAQVTEWKREKRHAREARMTPEQREAHRAKTAASAARWEAALTPEQRALKNARENARRKPRAKVTVSARRQQQIAVGAMNQIAFEVSIRKVIAAAAEQGTLDRGSDWAGMTGKQIMAAPLPPIRGNGWVMEEYEVAAIAAALAKHKTRTPVRRLSLAR